MAIGKDFSLVAVHSHVLLLGWATLGMTGIVYLVLPRCAVTRLAAWHFRLHNLGLPVAMVSTPNVRVNVSRPPDAAQA